MIGILAPLAVLVGASLVTLSSISSKFFFAQLLWVGIAACIAFVIQRIDWRGIFRSPGVIWSFYGISIALLVFVLLFGPVIRNIKGWIVLGPFTFQPVELAKLTLIVFLASYFSRAHVRIARYSTLMWSGIVAALPAGLVALQPDLGSVIILVATWFGLAVVSGLPVRRILLAVAVGAIGIVVLWVSVLKPYQKERVLGVIYPERDLLGVNYSVNQAKIAVGSAGIFGKGYGQGSQTQLGFLTEPQGDFVLAALTEEWGWMISVIVLAAFAWLILSILQVGTRVSGNFEKLVCMGTAIMFTVQFMINAGSTLGLLPVIGVPFPFLSYGGSSLLANTTLVGIVYAAARRT